MLFLIFCIRAQTISSNIPLFFRFIGVTLQYIIQLSLIFLVLCPNHNNSQVTFLDSLLLEQPIRFLVCSFLMLSFLVIPHIHLSMLILAISSSPLLISLLPNIQLHTKKQVCHLIKMPLHSTWCSLIAKHSTSLSPPCFAHQKTLHFVQQ